jgi:hypothetical protein
MLPVRELEHYDDACLPEYFVVSNNTGDHLLHSRLQWLMSVIFCQFNDIPLEKSVQNRIKTLYVVIPFFFCRVKFSQKWHNVNT